MENSGNCLVCASKENKKIFSCEKFELFKCGSCHNAWLSSRGRETYEEEFYTDKAAAYYRNYKKDYNENEYPIPLYKKVVSDIKYLGYSSGRLLEIGCSKGIFLHLADKEGFSVYGLDTSQYAIDYIRDNFSLPAACSDLAGASFPDSSFDIVVMIDVLEHIGDTEEILRQIYRILKPGGIMVIDTPNEASLINRLSFFWYKFSLSKIKLFVRCNHDIVHLVYFSPFGLRSVLDSHSFRVVKMEFFNIDPSLMGFNWIVNLCAKFVFFVADILRMQNKMLVFAKKQNSIGEL